MPYKVLAFGLTDVGLVRQNNEDCWGQIPSLNFFVLADGMGGHRAGEIASKEAVASLLDILKRTIGSTTESLDLNEMNGIIHYAIEYANEVVYKMSKKDRELRGMGTTVCTLLFHPQGLVYAHVGDSRIYRFRQGKLDQLTKDDSLVRQMIDAGKITNNSPSENSYKGIITKAIGTERNVDPSVYSMEFFDKDIYMMCTDGLTDMVSFSEIESILTQYQNIEQAAYALVLRAKEKGGFDNVTVVLTQIENSNEPKDLFRQ